MVYLPGAPNPWSGSVVYVTPDRVVRLGMSMSEAVKNIRTQGRGSEQVQSKLATDLMSALARRLF